MIFGLGIYYSGFVRRKNVLSIFVSAVAAIAVVTIQVVALYIRFRGSYANNELIIFNIVNNLNYKNRKVVLVWLFASVRA